MKKQNLINLIKYHVEKNDAAFLAEVVEIAKAFDARGDQIISEYLMELISTANYYVPQSNYKNLQYLHKINYSTEALHLPDIIEEDIVGVIRAIDKKNDISKFLFYGMPGSGKTESAYQIARLLGRDILSINFEQLIDSRLGETAKNVSNLFEEINHLPSHKILIVFDEIDSLVLDRINKNDLREMGRVTSIFLRELDNLDRNIPLIATTNLIDNLDKALVRRFDAAISFDRYSKEDLISIADSILLFYIRKAENSKQDKRLFHKILKTSDKIPYPGDLKQIIKTSIAFSDTDSEYDYLRKFYMTLNGNPKEVDIQELKNKGFTTREIEILSKIPKSSVSRKLRGN